MMNITFEQMPQTTSSIWDAVQRIEEKLKTIEKQLTHKTVDRHTPMSVKEAADYLRLPVNTVYIKLAAGEIPATKATKRWAIYKDESDRWLEAARKNDVPMTPEQANEAELNSHRRKPEPRKW
jgi:excisionase family DNA binding protein